MTLANNFQVLEGVVYYVAPTQTQLNAMNAFVGSKERVRIPYYRESTAPCRHL